MRSGRIHARMGLALWDSKKIRLNILSGVFKGALDDGPQIILAPKCHLKRHLTTIIYACYAKLHSCIFACDAVNLMVSCSLFVFMQKIIFTVEKNHTNCCNQSCSFWLKYQSDFLWVGIRPDPTGGAYNPPQTLQLYLGAYF